LSLSHQVYADKLEIETLLANGNSQRFIAHRYKTTEANLTNLLKKKSLKRSEISKL
jgi:transcriptional regulator